MCIHISSSATKFSRKWHSKHVVKLSLYDLRGRRVAHLVDGVSYPRGTHEVAWDARDDRGSRVGSGIYLLELVTPSTREVTKVTYVE